MKCVICNNGETEPGRATMTLERDETTLVIKDVPAEICQNCGGKYFDEETTDELLKIAETAVAAGVQVDVRKYVAA